MDAVEPIRLDCLGLLCPLPVIRVQERVASLVPGTLLEVRCSDPGALEDIPAWCRLNGHPVLQAQEEGAVYVVRLRVGAA